MRISFRLKIAAALWMSGLTFFQSGALSPAWGETINGSVRRISVSEATGQSALAPPKIELSPGYGVNISFIPTGETVQKVWFDNPSFATLDADGCLSGLGGQQRECQRNSVSVLHLRLINPLTFPGLPKTNSTLLTVITSGKAGRHVYLFQVAKGSARSPQSYTIEITPRPETTSHVTRYRSVVESVLDWQTLQRGLTVAQQKGLIRQNQPLWNRIQNFLLRVKAGESVEPAAVASGISLDLVRRLEELGKTGTPVAPAPLNASPTSPQQTSEIVRSASV